MNVNSLKTLDAKSLHLEAVTAARNYRRAESELLDILEVVSERKSFLESGTTSLYQYCVEALHLSESIAYSLISVVRKAKQVPELKAAIQSGEITLSKAKKICSVITAENQDAWLALAKTETSRVIEKSVHRNRSMLFRAKRLWPL